jgi:hypothetical protein
MVYVIADPQWCILLKFYPFIRQLFENRHILTPNAV